MTDAHQVEALAAELFAIHLPSGGWRFGFDNARRRAGACDYRGRRITVSQAPRGDAGRWTRCGRCCCTRSPTRSPAPAPRTGRAGAPSPAHRLRGRPPAHQGDRRRARALGRHLPRGARARAVPQAVGGAVVRHLRAAIHRGGAHHVGAAGGPGAVPRVGGCGGGRATAAVRPTGGTGPTGGTVAFGRRWTGRRRAMSLGRGIRVPVKGMDVGGAEAAVAFRGVLVPGVGGCAGCRATGRSAYAGRMPTAGTAGCTNDGDPAE